jgi:hypothetical protein
VYFYSHGVQLDGLGFGLCFSCDSIQVDIPGERGLGHSRSRQHSSDMPKASRSNPRATSLRIRRQSIGPTASARAPSDARPPFRRRLLEPAFWEIYFCCRKAFFLSLFFFAFCHCRKMGGYQLVIARAGYDASLQRWGIPVVSPGT